MPFLLVLFSDLNNTFANTTLNATLGLDSNMTTGYDVDTVTAVMNSTLDLANATVSNISSIAAPPLKRVSPSDEYFRYKQRLHQISSSCMMLHIL